MKQTKKSSRRGRRTQSRPFPNIGLLLFVVIFAGVGSYVVLHSFASSPTNHYVSPSGSDRTDGSAGSPFRRSQRGADSAGAGTTVRVASGAYSPLTINASGTASAPLTIVAD